jgi:lysophospholipase
MKLSFLQLKFVVANGLLHYVFAILYWQILVLGLTWPVDSAQAVSEQALTNGFSERLQEFMASEGEKSSFTTDDGAVIHYQRFDQSCNGKAVIILPGWSEPYLKYAEVIYDLRHKHYCVYTFDFRGQGLSSRQVANTQVGYVKDFSRYVDDLQNFYRLVVAPKHNRQVVLLSHSMGGLVAALYGIDHPGNISGAIMIAPMFAINTGPWPHWLAYDIASGLDWLGYGASYVFGHGDWREKPFSENQLTHSKARYEYGVRLFRDDKHLIIGGVSNRWLKTSMDYGEKALRQAPRFKSRLLMFEADDDSFVLHKPLQRFCRAAPHCEKLFMPGSKHELLMETDVIRDKVLARIFKFLEEK